MVMPTGDPTVQLRSIPSLTFLEIFSGGGMDRTTPSIFPSNTTRRQESQGTQSCFSILAQQQQQYQLHQRPQLSALLLDHCLLVASSLFVPACRLAQTPVEFEHKYSDRTIDSPVICISLGIVLERFCKTRVSTAFIDLSALNRWAKSARSLLH